MTWREPFDRKDSPMTEHQPVKDDDLRQGEKRGMDAVLTYSLIGAAIAPAAVLFIPAT